ncbi:MAG: CopG family transcriptional regulator [Gammaproteobacteria bacterium]|nr:CopG family transcriptional regulator [Gammaproteobacteria bacterium]
MPTLTVRISDEEKARLDAAARYERLQTGNGTSNSDLIRQALKQFLDACEKEAYGHSTDPPHRPAD